MSSPSSSSSGTAGRSRRPLPPRSEALQWGAAAVTAVALYGLPFAVVATLGTFGPWPVVLLALDLLVLVAVANLVWSPLVVLGAVLVATASDLVAWFGVAFAGTCGDSAVAGVVEPVGALLLALPIATWGVRHGARVLWAMPAGCLAASLWVVACAHVIPNGAGFCFE